MFSKSAGHQEKTSLSPLATVVSEHISEGEQALSRGADEGWA